jgi:hypothetical protein
MFEVMAAGEMWPSGSKGVVVGSKIPARLLTDMVIVRQDYRIKQIINETDL